jgi:hypothetical protein
MIVVSHSRARAFWAILAVLEALSGCGADAPPPRPVPWSGFIQAPPKPGASITNTKMCECRACDPDSCCHGDQTEETTTAPADCSKSYEFSEQCGIRVQTCTPRCYSKVWRVSKLESCDATRPLACCH